MDILQQREHEEFVLHKEFDIKLLSPIANYVNWKLNNDWDDYNELYHVAQLVNQIEKNPELWFHTHTIQKSGLPVGVLLIVGGKITAIEESIEDEARTLLLKYFHIVEKGKGYGSHWLNSVIFPHYKALGYKKIFVSSSHKKSFSFYSKLGEFVKDYSKTSDNQLFKREGKSFLLSL
ncbi:MAG: hypothetical protein CMO01_25030 [Thalassobius sp.]|nr:hypothetical protein [Thalassovita sp.]